MNYEEYKRKKDQLEKRRDQLKKQVGLVDNSLKKLKMDRLKSRIDNLEDSSKK